MKKIEQTIFVKLRGTL